MSPLSRPSVPDAEPARLFVGRSVDCDIFVASPRVAARHAELLISGYAGQVRDLGTRFGTTVNHCPVGDWTPFGPGDRIQVGGSELIIDGPGRVRVDPARPGASVCVAGLGVTVGRRRKQLLRSISFVAEPGEFVGLMGPSGGGKSTLLKSIVGLFAPSWGAVLINGVDVAHDPDRARLAVGYVPQDDIVHADLTVREALRYGAAMRLPLDTTPEEIESRISVVMNDLGIAAAADTLIGSADRQGISGGQRKRVNLALELLAQPPLLLLDEPTSGLSSEDAGKVFALLRQLADAGHTIVMTAHGPSLAEFSQFDRVVYLSEGELVYYGPAWPESADYFCGIVRDRLGEAAVPVDEGAGTALRCLELLKQGGVAPRELAVDYETSNLFEQNVATRLGQVEPQADGVPRLRPSLDWLMQLRNQTGRYFHLKLRNRGSLPIQLAQAPVVALLVNWAFGASPEIVEDGKNLSTVLFFLTIASIWFGCSNAAREIVGERAILVRDKMNGLGVVPYLLSKLALLGTLAGLQCVAMLLVTAGFVRWPQFAADPLAAGLVQVQMAALLWANAVLGTLLGLSISAFLSSSESALSATPLLLIPEILLSGAIIHIDLLPEPLRPLTHLIGTRWAFEGLLHLHSANWARTYCCGNAVAGLQAASLALACLIAGCLLLLLLRLAGSPRRFL